MICTPFTGCPVKGVHINATEGLLYMQQRRFQEGPPFYYPLLIKEGVK